MTPFDLSSYSEDLFKLVFDESYDIILLLDSETGKIIRVNNSVERILGYTKEELIGEHFSYLFPKKQKENPKQIIERIQVFGSIFGAQEFLRKDGTVAYMDLNAGVFKSDSAKIILATLRDVNERKKIEDTLRILSSAVENSPNSILILNSEGFIEYVNKKFEIKSGFNSKHTIALRLDNHPAFLKFSEDLPFIWHQVSNGKTYNGEVTLIDKHGKLYCENLIFYPIKSSTGQILKYVAIFEDISDKKQAEKKAEEFASELQDIILRKDKFFSIIAHDLRSPFNSLLGFSEILVDEIDTLTKKEIETFAKNILNTAKGVYNLIENLLQWSRLQSGNIDFQPKTINLYNIVNQIVSLLSGLALKKKIEITVNVNSGILVFADENMIYSVLQNLITNAIKFTNPGGAVLVEASEDNGFVTVCVSDTGMGIPEDKIDYLFRADKHFTTLGTDEERGSGLGLILSKELIEKNSGKIWVRSIWGVGSNFYFTLPKN